MNLVLEMVLFVEQSLQLQIINIKLIPSLLIKLFLRIQQVLNFSLLIADFHNFQNICLVKFFESLNLSIRLLKKLVSYLRFSWQTLLKLHELKQ